jgi:hypothetical protein
MRPKKILPKIFLVCGLLLILLIIRFRKEIKEYPLSYLGSIFSGLTYERERRAPLTFLEQEEKLKVYMGEPFAAFGEKEWQEFWNIIYGAFPKGPADKLGLSKKMRQLTTLEIERKLTALYPSPFEHFQDRQWQAFFSLIIKEKKQ